MQEIPDNIDLDAVYREYANLVYRFLYAHIHDAEWAQELMQETFLRAIDSINRYDGSCKLSTWLCQIAKHLLYQHWDKSHRVQLEELDESLQSRQDTAQHAMARVELADVWDRLQALPPDARKTVELRVLGDLSFREIGDILGKTENWARVTFYRAKLALIQRG